MGKRRDGFSLLELLVIVAILAMTMGILLPVLSGARASARHVRCLANLRTCAAGWRLHAHDHDDRTPALGVPWSSEPNWALVVMRHAGSPVPSADALPTGEDAVLVCPSTQALHADVPMSRTYAANVTGFAGAPGDRGDFDAEPTFAQFSRVAWPAHTPMLLDSKAIPPGPGLPPPTRTASVIDFRDESHVSERIGRVHGSSPLGGHFHVAWYDGSAARRDAVEDAWRRPINE